MWIVWLVIGFLVGAFIGHTIANRGCEATRQMLRDEVQEEVRKGGNLAAKVDNLQAIVYDKNRKISELRDENVRLLNDQFKEELET